MSVNRIHRLLQLITLLQSRRARRSHDLRLELNVSRRTLFRDLELLHQAGIPCFHESESGYRIARGFFMPPVSLTVPETLGLMLLGKTAQTHRGQLLDAGISGINKLTSTVPDPIRAACSDMMAHVTVDLGAASTAAVADREARYYPTLQRCVDECRSCRMEYRQPLATSTKCVLRPYLLHYAAGAWYVMGKTDRRRKIQVLKLARIQTLEPLPQRFHRPPLFRTSAKLGRAWLLEPEGTVYRIELEFSAQTGASVAEVLWHSSQKHKLLADGRCVMHFEVDGLGEIAQWICGYADQVIVRKPAALRDRVQEMLRSALHGYGQIEPGCEP